MMVISLVLVSVVHSGGAQTVGTSFSGIIVSDTTWTQENSPYTLIGNALVSNGATLTIQPGVTVNLGSYYMMVNGTLQAVGSSNTPVTFTCNSNTYGSPSGGQLTFTKFCNGWNSATSTGCELVNAIINCPLIISNSVKIAQDKILQGINVQSELNSLQTGTPVISNNLIRGGISVGSALGSAIIKDNNITSGGISFGSINPPNITISGNTISGCGTGISAQCWGGGMNNIVQLIEDNLIFNNSQGIVLSDWEGGLGPIIEHNTVTNNTVGICVSYPWGNNSPVLNATIQYNNLDGNSRYAFQNQQPTTVNAIHNWWGTTDTQAISQAIYDYYDDFNIGQVTYYPFLTSPDTGGPTYTLPTPVTSTPTPAPTSSSSPTPTPTTEPTRQNATTLPVTTDKGAIVDLSLSGNITGSQMSGVIIATNQSATTTIVSFTLTGQSGTTGFSNLTIAKNAVPYGKIPAIYIDGQLAENQGYMQDDKNYYVWYTAHFSSHEISIVFASGNNIAPKTVQAQTNYLQAIYGVAAGAAIVAAIVVALTLLMRSRKQKTI